MGHRSLSRGRGLLVVFICKLVVYDVNKAFGKQATFIQDYPDCRPYRDSYCSRGGGVLVILCMFSLSDRKATSLILIQNIFSTQDHAAAAYVDHSLKDLLTFILRKQDRCHWCSRLRMERGDRGRILVVYRPDHHCIPRKAAFEHDL